MAAVQAARKLSRAKISCVRKSSSPKRARSGFSLDSNGGDRRFGKQSV